MSFGDKAATFRFKRPGTETLYAEFRIDESEIDEIKSLLLERKSIDRIYEIEIKNQAGKTYCVVEKTIHIARG